MAAGSPTMRSECSSGSRRRTGGDEHEDAVGVAVDQSWHRRMRILTQRVTHHRLETFQLSDMRHDLLAHRAIGIVGVDQRSEVRRDLDAEFALRL